jgi:hypothetical protein
MKKTFRPWVALITLAVAILACSSSFDVVETQPSPLEQSNTLTAAPDEQLPLAPEQNDTPTVVSDELLPHSLYYLGADSAGLMQVFRAARDGKTVTQLTFEPVNVLDYDVALTDGSVIYEANSQLVLINADGSNRRVLVEGLPNPNNTRGYYRPVFSPDGQTLAYSINGINLYTVSTGVSNLVLENQLIEGPDFFGRETYVPEKYSPDGTKMVIHLLYSDTSSLAIYYPASNSLVRLSCAADVYICEGGAWFYSDIKWSADSSSFYAAVPTATSTYAGDSLWSVDAATGAVTALTPAGMSDETIDVPKALYQAPDGQFYFFFGEYDMNSGLFDASELHLVRSAPADMNNRTILSDENFVSMKEALWAPDADFVIVVSGPEVTSNNGQAELVYLDGRPNVVLTASAQQLKWGP